MSDVSKARRKALKAIEGDLKRLGSVPSDVQVTSAKGVGRRILSLLTGPGFGDTEEVLCVSADVYDCHVEIAVPIAKWGFTPPFVMDVHLPVPIDCRAEYRRGALGKRWRCEPKDKEHVAALKKTVPKARMKENQVSKRVPVQCEYKVDVGHAFEPAEDGGTHWMIHTAYEGGFLSGGHRPRVGKYLAAVPAVREMLEGWHGAAAAGARR